MYVLDEGGFACPSLLHFFPRGFKRIDAVRMHQPLPHKLNNLRELGMCLVDLLWKIKVQEVEAAEKWAGFRESSLDNSLGNTAVGEDSANFDFRLRDHQADRLEEEGPLIICLS